MSDQIMKNEKKLGIIGTIALAVAIIGFAVLGILNLNQYYSYVVFAIGIILAIYGIVRMYLYFKRNEYKSIKNFGFSIGIFSIVIGIIICLNGSELVKYFSVATGIATVAFGAIMLQHAAAMKILGSNQWRLSIIYSIYSICIGIVILLDLFKISSLIDIRFHCFVIVTSVLYIISVITNYSVLIKYNKNQELGAKRNIEDDPQHADNGGTDIE